MTFKRSIKISGVWISEPFQRDLRGLHNFLEVGSSCLGTDQPLKRGFAPVAITGWKILLWPQEGGELQDKHCGPGEGKDYERETL